MTLYVAHHHRNRLHTVAPTLPSVEEVATPDGLKGIRDNP
jgi:hypothetical protein